MTTAGAAFELAIVRVVHSCITGGGAFDGLECSVGCQDGIADRAFGAKAPADQVGSHKGRDRRTRQTGRERRRKETSIRPGRPSDRLCRLWRRGLVEEHRRKVHEALARKGPCPTFSLMRGHWWPCSIEAIRI